MTLFRATLVLLAGLLLAPVQASAGQDMPTAMQQWLTLAPGCTVSQAMTMEQTEICILTCAGTPADAVAAYYKEQLAAKGFTIEMESGYPGGSVLVAAKSAATASVDVSDDNGVTQASLTLDGADQLASTTPDATAPDATAAQAKEAQAKEAEETLTAEKQAAAQDDGEQSGQGMAAEIWKCVPARQGDRITEEFVVNDSPVAMLATTASPCDILDHYKAALLAKGWMMAAYHMGEDGGLLTMMQENKTLQVVCETRDKSDAGMNEYTIMLTDL